MARMPAPARAPVAALAAHYCAPALLESPSAMRQSPITYLLLLALAAGYALQLASGERLLASFALWPWGSAAELPVDGGSVSVGFAPWQVVSYSFLHGNLLHLFVNAFALWMFGPPIERLFGPGPYLQYWFACVVGAALTQLATLGQAGTAEQLVPTIGASGGTFGLLLAFGMLYPRQRVMLLFPPIPMPAWLFVILYGALELYLGVIDRGSGVAHFAHLGGMLAGLVLIQYWRGRLPLKPRRRLMR
jgi:membrane associated rhomboid family serine protease